MQLKFLFIILGIFFLSVAKIDAQENQISGVSKSCAEKLKMAQNAYDNGLLEQIPHLLTKCINNLNKTQRIEAYRVLILSYLFNNQAGLADEYMEKLLKFDPLFIPFTYDPIEFGKLYDSYRTEPIYSIGALLGGAITFPDIADIYTAFNTSNNITKYRILPSFSFSLFFNKYISDQIKLNLTINLQQNRYTAIQKPFPFNQTEISDNLIYIGLGLAGIYELGNLKTNLLKPYVRLGIQPINLVSANANATRIYTDESKPTITDQGIPISNIRNRYNLSIFSSIGIKYRTGKSWIFADLAYNRNLFLSNNSNKRFQNNELLFKYFYIDNNFYLQNINLMFGVVQSFYNPQKRKLR